MGWIANAARAVGLGKAGVVTGTGTTFAGPPETPGMAAGQGGIIFNDGIPLGLIQGLSAAELYQTQPHLRTVVSFVARNAAQLGRHVYTRDAEDNRTRVKGSALGSLLDDPNDYMTGYDLFNHLFTELALYDIAIWVPKFRDGRWQIDPIPSSWLAGKEMADAFRVERYKVQPPNSGAWYWVDAEDAVVFHGYGPNGGAFGSSAVLSLKYVLQEQLSAYQFRDQMWKRGGRVGMFLHRPKDAPIWSKEAREAFVAMWRSWAGSGGNAGSTPLLEDGMELKAVRFNAKEEQWLEAATLSLSTVASSYHVPPAMVGVSGYNSFASVKEFRKMLYTETLGPIVAQVEGTINRRLTRIIAAPPGEFLELNIAEKLQGDFEEQAAQIFQAVGGPFMVVNEARKLMNLRPLPGGDELLAPLNMGAVGNNGPAADTPIDAQDSPEPPADPTPPKSHDAAHGARVDNGIVLVKAPSALEDDLAGFFKNQRDAILRALGQKAPSWFDQKHWNRELSAVIEPHLQAISTDRAKSVARAKGLNPADYSVAQTKNFLRAVADSRADLINTTTRTHYESALDNEADPADVYADIDSRSKTVAGTITTFVTAWATVEVVKQLASDRKAQKTWVSSGLANSRHSDLNGETVDLDDHFSNGAMYPGDPTLGPEDVANCGCSVDITFD